MPATWPTVENLVELNSVFWLQSLEVALLASVKFLLAPFEAERHGFSWMQAFLVTTAGGLAGITSFTFLGEQIVRGWHTLKRRIAGIFKRKTQTRPDTRRVPRKFTSGNRLIANVRRRFGLFGIAFITPCIISIPIGTMIATGLYPNRWMVLRYLYISLIIWSLLLNTLAQTLNLSELFNRIF